MPLSDHFNSQLALTGSGSDVHSAAGAETAQSLSINPQVQLAWTYKSKLYNRKIQYSLGIGEGYTSTANDSTPLKSQPDGLTQSHIRTGHLQLAS